MNPNWGEKYRQETANRLIDLLEMTGKPISMKLIQDSNDIYCSTDYSKEICEIISHLKFDVYDRIVDNSQDSRSRKLKVWWIEHQNLDMRKKRLIGAEK
jgi:hypothetical protein